MDETVADAASSVLRRTQRNGVWTVTVQEEDLEARIQNILNDVLERPSPDVALARAASQYEHEDLMGSCDKAAEFFADTSSLDFVRELSNLDKD